MLDELAEESSSDHSTNPKSPSQADPPQPNSPIQQPNPPDQQQSSENSAMPEQQSTPTPSQAQENIESDQLPVNPSPGQGKQIPERNPAEEVRLFYDQSSDMNSLFSR